MLETEVDSEGFQVVRIGNKKLFYYTRAYLSELLDRMGSGDAVLVMLPSVERIGEQAPVVEYEV